MHDEPSLFAKDTNYIKSNAIAMDGSNIIKNTGDKMNDLTAVNNLTDNKECIINTSESLTCDNTNNDAKKLINSNKRSRLSDTHDSNDENMNEENQIANYKDIEENNSNNNSNTAANINKNVFNRDSFKSNKADIAAAAVDDNNHMMDTTISTMLPNDKNLKFNANTLDHYNPNELMSLMLKMKNNHLIKNENDTSHHPLIPTDDQISSPLIRTSSNASSTSTTSTTSSAVSALSSSSYSLKENDNHYNNFNSDSLSSLSSSLSSNSSMSMLNENHFKALIMSAAAAASKNKPNSSSNSSQDLPDKMSYYANEDMSKTANVAAAFADQFANIVRSRSSSLSDSSASSLSASSCSSSIGSYNQKGPNKILDYAVKSIGTMMSQEFTSPNEAVMSQNEFINSIMTNPNAKHLNNPMTATIMKQMINSYQAAFNTKPNQDSPFSKSILAPNQNGSKPFSTELMSAELTTNTPEPNQTKPSYSIISPTGTARKSSASMPTGVLNENKPMSLQSTAQTTNDMYNSMKSNLNVQMNPTAQKFLTPDNKNEEIKAKINEVANKTIINNQSPNSTPCKVCGDEASGFHYGVDSCEGCKGFFRRCITQGMNHQCTNNQQCEMTPFSRNSCQFCRLKKCFAVGMSREASRLGRRPKRPKDDRESTMGMLTNSFDSSCNNSNMDNITPNTTPLKQIQSQSSYNGLRQINEMHKSSPKNINETNNEVKSESSHEQSNSQTDSISKDNVSMTLSSNLSSNMNIVDESSTYSMAKNFNKDTNNTFTIRQNHQGSNLVQSLEFNSSSASMQPPFKLDSFYDNNQQSAKVESPVSKLEFESNKNSTEVVGSNEVQYPKKLDKLKSSFNKINDSNIEEVKDVNENLKYKDLLMVTNQKKQEVTQQNEVKTFASNINNYTENLKVQTSAAQLQKETSQQQMQQIEMLTKLISISDRHTSIERTNELEYMRSTIIESHGLICQTTSEKLRRRYSERPPVRVTYSPIKEMQTWDNFIKAMVPLILDVVKFCKYIPGFNHIFYSDQVQLLKQGTFEVICVNSFMLVDAQNKLMITPDMEFIMDSTTLRMVPLGFFMSDVFELGLQVSQLKLTDAEIALYNAVLIMNPDRGDLHDKDSVEELQSTLLHVLYKHLKYYRPDGIDLFFKLLKLIPAVQELSRRHSEALNTVQASNSNYRNGSQSATSSSPTTANEKSDQQYNESANSFLKNELKEKKAKI